MPSYKDLLKTFNGYYIWPKYAAVKLNEYFTTDEFACPCVHSDCNEQRIHTSIVDKLFSLRKELGVPITVTSAFRCGRHQADLANTPGIETAKGTSTHELGQAVDMKCKKMTELYVASYKHFRAIGKAKKFLHVDLRDDKERRWTYGY